MNKCKGCQWYNKPYWSIINPCDSCIKEDNIEILIGDRGHSKTKEVIEDMQQEIERLNNIINGIDDIIKNHYIVGHTVQNSSIDSILKEIKQLKESGNNE